MKNRSKILLYIFALLFCGRVLNIDMPVAIYYIAIIISFLFLYFYPNNIRLQNKYLLIFILALFLSIIFNDISSFFKPYIRYFSFLLNILVFAPLFISPKLSIFKNELFQALSNIFILITLVSFVGLLLGIIPLIGFGGFQGITVHAMSLSVIASISLLICLQHFLIKKRLIFLVLLAISFIVLLLGASRAALLGTILGVMIFLLKLKNFKLTGIKPIIFILVSFSVFLVFLPDLYLERLIHKFNTSREMGNIISSRDALWEARFNEFKESPMYGIGFGNMLEKYNNYGINEETGGIETGTSWGMILSMSGLLGTVIFLILIYKRIKEIFKSENNIYNCFIAGTLIFFLVHMFFEGYVFASGNIFMILFWLTISQTHSNPKRL